jgi:quinol monooxygenase YgiN
MKGYCVTCVFNGNPETVAKMEAIIGSVYEKSLQEKGCLEYRWYQSHKNPDDFLLFMTWESQEAFEEHVKTEHVSHAEDELKGILKKPYQDIGWRFLNPR